MLERHTFYVGPNTLFEQRSLPNPTKKNWDITFRLRNKAKLLLSIQVDINIWVSITSSKSIRMVIYVST